MQTNPFVTPKTAELIDRRLERLLKDLGTPPPLRLEGVRALLSESRNM